MAYEFIDLGLSSETKWTNCNVGTNKPSDSGLFFQFGDSHGYAANQIEIGSKRKKFSTNWSDYK